MGCPCFRNSKPLFPFRHLFPFRLGRLSYRRPSHRPENLRPKGQVGVERGGPELHIVLDRHERTEDHTPTQPLFPCL